MGWSNTSPFTIGGTSIVPYLPTGGDDAPNINGFLAAGRVVQLVPGQVYSISTPINIGNGTSAAKSTVFGGGLITNSSGWAANQIGPATGATARIVASATFSGTAMLMVNGPIPGVIVEGVTLDCNSVAATGLYVAHAIQSQFTDIMVTLWTGDGIIVTAYPATIAGVADGADENVWTNVNARNPAVGTGKNGIRIGPAVDTGAPHFDVARNSFYQCQWDRSSNAGDSSLILQFADACQFFACTGSVLGGGLTGNCLTVIQATNATTFPKNIEFYGWVGLGAYNFPAIGSWPLPGQIAFYGLHAGDSAPIPAHAKVFGQTTFEQQFGRSVIQSLSPQSLQNNTLTNLTGCLLQLAANESWFFEIFLLNTATSTTMDIQFGWTVPGSCTMSWGTFSDNATSGGFTTVGAAASPVAMKTAAQVVTRGTAILQQGISLAGFIFCGATPGAAQLQFAQVNTEATNLTIDDWYAKFTKLA